MLPLTNPQEEETVARAWEKGLREWPARVIERKAVRGRYFISAYENRWLYKSAVQNSGEP